MKSMIGALVVMTVVGVANAADEPNFSGTWKINIAKSDYAGLPLPESFVRTIQHAEPSITIVEDQVGQGATPHTERKMTTDGKTTAIEINGAPVKVSAAWEDSALVATTAVDAVGVKFIDKMTLAADGKELNSVVQVESAQGNVTLKVVFDKQ